MTMCGTNVRGESVSMMKVDKAKVLTLATDILKTIEKRLDKTPMKAGEIQLALTQAIYRIGAASMEIKAEEALRGLDRVAA